MSAKICGACGGADGFCDGVGDLDPTAIGFPPTCETVTIPAGASCGGAISTLADLVTCARCVSEYAFTCADRC